MTLVIVMRSEKQSLTREYVCRLNASPFFLVVDYRGLNVAQFCELRRRLAQVGADLHVVKNSLFRIAAKEIGVTDLGGSLDGQVAAVTGRRDISAAAKALRRFQTESGKPKLKFGYLGDQRLELDQVIVLAELPPVEVLRGKLLGLLLAPASGLVRLMASPGQQFVRVLQAHAETIAPHGV